MTVTEAKQAVKYHIPVGISNVRDCLYSTGYLIRKVRKKFLFRDRSGELEVIRPASAFSLVK